MTRKQIALWATAVLAIAAAGVLAAFAVGRTLDLPPGDAKSLETILRMVEGKQLGSIRSVEYERDWWRRTGTWEVVACREACVKLYIDPLSGEETRRKRDDPGDEMPPAQTQGPSAIARSFEERKAGVIVEIEFEQGAWQVKYRESRGLLGALQPERKRVFEPTPVSLREGASARPKAPMQEAPRPVQRSGERLIGV